LSVTRGIQTVGACVLAFAVAGVAVGGGRWMQTFFGESRTEPQVSARLIDERGIDAASAEIRFAGSAASRARVFSLRAFARRLFPGGRRPLRVKISNHSRFPIKVTRIRVRVKRDPTHTACPPRKYVRKTRLRKPIKVARRRTRRVRLTIKLLYKAPDACQGAVFPLRLRGTAVRA
jgi:hypothetical protein